MRTKTHGLSKTRVFKIWYAMISRCTKPDHKFYRHYGGRGIYVCDRWLKLENFVSDMGHGEKGLYLDRVNNDGPYCPENCRWISPKISGNNTSRNFLISFNGQTKTLSMWCEELGLKYITVYRRLTVQKLDPAEAFSKPLKRKISYIKK